MPSANSAALLPNSAVAHRPPIWRSPSVRTTLSNSGKHVIPSADVAAGENDFYGVAPGPGGPWAAGRITDRTTDLTSPLIEKLDHDRWQTVPAPSSAGSGGGAGLGGVTTAPDGEAWTIGAYNTSSSSSEP